MKIDLQNHFDHIFVGGGYMNFSAALTLQQRESPNANIVIFEGSKTTTSSKGICRIISIPYIDPEYVLLAIETEKYWETELPYHNF